MKQDRRIRKTRAILKQSLISMMKEKSIKHITVKEICEKADINKELSISIIPMSMICLNRLKMNFSMN